MKRTSRDSGFGSRAAILVGVAAVALLFVVTATLLGGAPPAAAASAGKCAYCGARIEGDGIISDGRSYHKSCWLQHVAPRCAICGETLSGDYVVQEGKSYHRACWEKHVAARCSLCGEILQGEYLKDAWGNRYHPAHRKETAACEYCGRFISDRVTHGGVRYGDGRSVCNICRRTAVDGAGEGRKLMAQAAARLADVGVAVDPSRVRLELADLTRMGEVSGDRSRLRSGYTQYESVTTVGGARRSEAVTVYVLIGMPRLETIATLAHELTHVWLSRAERLNTRPALAEGNCNYAAMRVLAAYPGAESTFIVRKMKESTDDVYGEGLRRVIRYVDGNGVEAWLRLARTRDDFPAGY